MSTSTSSPLLYHTIFSTPDPENSTLLSADGTLLYTIQTRRVDGRIVTSVSRPLPPGYHSNSGDSTGGEVQAGRIFWEEPSLSSILSPNGLAVQPLNSLTRKKKWFRM